MAIKKKKKRKKQSWWPTIDWENQLYYFKIWGTLLVLTIAMIAGAVLLGRGEYQAAGVVPGVVFIGVTVVFVFKAAAEEGPTEVIHALLGLFVFFPYWIYFAIVNIDRYLVPLILSVAGLLFLSAGMAAPKIIEANAARTKTTQTHPAPPTSWRYVRA